MFIPTIFAFYTANNMPFHLYKIVVAALLVSTASAQLFGGRSRRFFSRPSSLFSRNAATAARLRAAATAVTDRIHAVAVPALALPAMPAALQDQLAAANEAAAAAATAADTAAATAADTAAALQDQLDEANEAAAAAETPANADTAPVDHEPLATENQAAAAAATPANPDTAAVDQEPLAAANEEADAAAPAAATPAWLLVLSAEELEGKIVWLTNLVQDRRYQIPSQTRTWTRTMTSFQDQLVVVNEAAGTTSTCTCCLPGSCSTNEAVVAAYTAAKYAIPTTYCWAVTQTNIGFNSAGGILWSPGTKCRCFNSAGVQYYSDLCVR